MLCVKKKKNVDNKKKIIKKKMEKSLSHILFSFVSGLCYTKTTRILHES